MHDRHAPAPANPPGGPRDPMLCPASLLCDLPLRSLSIIGLPLGAVNQCAPLFSLLAFCPLLISLGAPPGTYVCIHNSHTCLLITYVQSHLAACQCLLPTLTANCHFQPPAQNTPPPPSPRCHDPKPPPRPHSPYRGGNVLAFCHFARFASVPCYKARRFSPLPHVLT
ncbi:hypothetical protein [Cynomolgus macaque cytomegalovirus strain Mauritius]|uniref:Uncharacterized protein n=1 Tax=Cynomolgus macaque cytomegalovirus strain Mauritius TaxID=1690255 RepID=A0A0K1H058_9BETA|nr:hypothetical protein [Cynomolgus macaque cytomegalovirus strain Mauritius]AXG21910.1 hypothetical protein [synthetic construct]AXG22179.1 hypothetical protein [synthetic construct]